MALGTAAGAWQGYHGGKVDLLGQRFIEVWESLPFIYVLILLGSVYGQSFLLLLGVYAVFNWIGISTTCGRNSCGFASCRSWRPRG